MVINRGIIPARAGFTSPTEKSRGRPRDHPRSRGVYTDVKGQFILLQGSSPLARGLLPIIEHRKSRQRIIPARAGFTIGSRWPRVPPWDHPRSRGVYISQLFEGYTSSGSSPLARGLPADSSRGDYRDRIIPARAGFTSARDPTRPGRPDHPRSRGVYRPVCGVCARPIGSSPLARGLQVRPVPQDGKQEDHPRSRGVYGAIEIRPDWKVGSSPLARGLLQSVKSQPLEPGIIPARAGFTPRGRRWS